MELIALDAAGHRRSPATMPGYHHRRPPRNKRLRYPADPPTIEEIVAVMRTVGDALALAETDLDRSRGAVPGREWEGWQAAARSAWTAGLGSSSTRGCSSGELPVGTLLCVIHGPTAGRHWEASAARKRFITPQPPPASGDGSLHTNSDTHLRSRWPARAFRSS